MQVLKTCRSDWGVDTILKPKHHILKDFKFESGEVLPELELEYATQGIEKKDEDGNIENVFMYLHGWSGDYTSVQSLNDVIGSGKVIDTNSLYVISPTALGSPGSASPSTSDIRADFPQYTIKDMIMAHYRLITEKLEIKYIRGIMGTSMGGFQALNWALEFPEIIDFLILNGTSHCISNRMYGVYSLMNRIIMDDPGYNAGNYIFNPITAMENSANLSFLWSLSPQYYEKCFASSNEIISAVEEMRAEARAWDANDIFWRNKALLGHDLSAKLSNIKIPALVIGIKEDQVVDVPNNIIPLHNGLENSKIFVHNSILGHYGCVKDIKNASGAIENFMSSQKELTKKI